MGKRLQLQLPDASVARLDALKERTEAASYAVIIRDAIRLYEWMLGEIAAGKEFAIKEPDGTFRVVQIFVGYAE